MWSPSNCKNKNNNNSKAVLGSPSKESSSCSSPPPTNPANKKSIEEVWKDISLSSLHHPTTTFTTTNYPTFNNMVLQDFFARPCNKEKQKSMVYDSHGHDETSSAAPCGGAPPRPPPPSPPATVLNLKSVPDQFHYFETTQTPSSTVSYLNLSFDPLTSSTGGVSCCCKKRATGNEEDRRHKRAMKNRESAARSRSRKHAYTNVLELEVAHLMKENAKLRRQQEKIHSATASAQLPKKHSLIRALTAPF